jgi:hypothetical protein
MENYLDSQRDQIFSNVAVLIYIFDVESQDVQVCKFEKILTVGD